jgi:hypothetical protein
LHNISLRHLLAHGNLGGLNDLLSFLVIKNKVSQFILNIFSDILTFFNVSYNLAEDAIIGDDFTELGEVPREPLLQSHHEGVDVLVHRLDQSDGLDDGLVLSVDVGGALFTRVLMGKTELGTGQVLI